MDENLLVDKYEIADMRVSVKTPEKIAYVFYGQSLTEPLAFLDPPFRILGIRKENRKKNRQYITVLTVSLQGIKILVKNLNFKFQLPSPFITE